MADTALEKEMIFEIKDAGMFYLTVKKIRHRLPKILQNPQRIREVLKKWEEADKIEIWNCNRTRVTYKRLNL